MIKQLLTINFWVLVHISYAQVSDFETIKFSEADYTAKLHYGASLDNLPLLVYNLTHKLPADVEKFRAIYIWVSTNINVDSRQGDKVIGKRKKYKNDSVSYAKWNMKYKKIAFEKLLEHKKTMCTGYAYLIKHMCFLANIDCEIIDGYARSASSNVERLELANHSWNAVKLNEKWYLCDATWSSGYLDGAKDFVKKYNDGYFLTDPILFSKNHYPLESKWLLNDTLISSGFIKTPIVYGETFIHKVIPIYPEKMNATAKRHSPVAFSFKTLKSESDRKIELVTFLGNQELPISIENLNQTENMTSFTSTFKYNGSYDVHLKINDAIVASYNFKVSN